jgi:hypothetical protein
MDYLEALRIEREGDKWTIDDLELVIETLPDIELAEVPWCMFREDKSVVYPVLAVLAWVRARRDDPEITLETVKKSIGNGNIREITRELIYYYTDATREAIAESIKVEAEEEESPETETEKPVKNARSGSKSKT